MAYTFKNPPPQKSISEMSQEELKCFFKNACYELLKNSQRVNIDDALKHIKYDLVWQTECNQDKDNRTFTIKVKPEIKNIRWEE
jgi:hypothetical protein